MTSSSATSILVFRPSVHYEDRWDCIATGNLLSIDPDRIMLKKIILFGNPIRVRKRSAVVKHMFFTPQDVRWFKPAELVTLQGLRGHIKESVGTHGLFKALFSAPIKQNDQVLLILYKRVFPKVPTLQELTSSASSSSAHQQGRERDRERERGSGVGMSVGMGIVGQEEAEELRKKARLLPSVDFDDAERSSVIVK